MVDKRIAEMLEMRRAGMTYPEIGASYSVTAERVRQMIGHIVSREKAWDERKKWRAVYGTKRGPSLETLEKRERLARRNLRMLEMRRKGMTYEAIAAQFGITYVGARKAILLLEEEQQKGARRAARR
jgi:DNA-directed RNA polymerase sigma subunit (sigma70/sigma32)